MGLRHMQIYITGDLYTGMTEGFGDRQQVHALCALMLVLAIDAEKCSKRD